MNTTESAPAYAAWFECFDRCGAPRRELTEIVYRCECGSLLEVVHDIEALRSRSGLSWTRLFEDRYRRNSYPYGSGVWGKKEWVCPIVDDQRVISMFEGGSNLFWAERYGRKVGVEDLWVKQCGNSHTGSFKDLGMTVLVSVVNQMLAEGSSIRAVACASTGDTSAALAAYCAAAAIPSVVFLPKGKVSIAQLVQPLANGAIVCSLDTDFDGCMRVVQEVTKDERIYLANSMNSLRIEGQKTVGIEIVQQLDWQVPDVVIIPGGNLGNVTALGKGFLLMRSLGVIDRLPRIVVAQAERANPLYLSFQSGFRSFEPIVARTTLASAIQIGNPVSVHKAIRVLEEFEGLVEVATEDELANAAHRADLTGMYNCPHTGVALGVLEKLVKRGDIAPEERVVVISTAHGLKFTDFKVRYHEDSLEDVVSRHQNRPLELPPDPARVVDAVEAEIERRAPPGRSPAEREP